MSISSNRSAVARITREIAELHKKMADEGKKEATLMSKVVSTRNSITKSSSSSTVESKLKQIAQITNDISKVNVKKADIQKKIAQKETELNRYQNNLAKDEVAEDKKRDAANKKREAELKEFEKRLKENVATQNRLTQNQLTVSSLKINNSTILHRKEGEPEYQAEEEYDVFISHASEDKEVFVRGFASHLQSLGVKVWYDEFSLKWGDSLRKSIDKGLASSRFGIVVISKAFTAKPWTDYELNGLVAGEIEGTHRILPIWHEISKSEVLKFSPSLADKLAMNTSINTVEEIAQQLLPLLRN